MFRVACPTLEIINTFSERTFGPIASVSIQKQDEGCRGLLASVKGQWDHSKGTLLPAGWSQWERWPVWDLTSLEKMERTVHSVFYIQLIPRIRSGDSALCLCIHKHTMSAAMHLCASAYHFSFCLSTMPWCLFVCERVWVYSCLHLSSRHCTHKMNHLPHKSKELTEAFSYR